MQIPDLEYILMTYTHDMSVIIDLFIYLLKPKRLKKKMSENQSHSPIIHHHLLLILLLLNRSSVQL